MRFTIKLKLALAFAVIILMVAGMATLAISNLASLNTAVGNMVTGPITDINNIRALANAYSDAVRAEKNAVLSNDAAEIAGYVKRVTKDDEDTRADIAKLKGSTNADVVKEAIKIGAVYDEVWPLRKQILEYATLNTTEGNAKGADLSMHGVKAFNNQIFDEMDKMVGLIDANLHQTDESTNQLYTTSRTVLLSFIGGVTLFSIGIALWMSLTISRGLKRGIELAEAVAIGDLSKQVQHKANDEIKDLIAAMERMTANLSATAAIATEIAEGNLMVAPKPLSDKDTLGQALERMVERLRAVVKDAIAASDNVSSGSQQLSSASEQIAQGASEQAASAEEASSSMEEMASNIKQNADNASQTEKIARQSAKDAEISGDAVSRAVKAMST
ncbi:MAG: methyl-accepting chemotaxis protein, partial [Ancalomicrobiaceae bacterium]|nr:methyl-accepting chemotaxis protein [Ancalomicrobiaceae bacterium]